MQTRDDIDLAFERTVSEALRDQYAQVLSEPLPNALLQLLDLEDWQAAEPAID